MGKKHASQYANFGWLPSSYIKISAPHGNEDGLRSYDDRPHAHKTLNFFSNIRTSTNLFCHKQFSRG